MSSTATSERQSPFRCDMSMIAPAQRKQHVTTATAVFRRVEEIRELSDGYVFRLPNDATALLQTAEFISLEKLCCPFFRFNVEVEPEAGPLWLRLTGTDGIKPFIRAELGAALPESLARSAQFR